jgi:hypothetical protein
MGMFLAASVQAQMEMHMCRLGVHFAISQDEAARLRAIADDKARLDFVEETIGRAGSGMHPDFKVGSDTSWDAMHRTLADGNLNRSGGSYPLNHVVLGGERLYGGDDYIVSLKTAEQVRDIAAALAGVRELAFRYRYFAIDPQSYGAELSDEDFAATWRWYQSVRALYSRAAQAGRCVLFTAGQ